MKINVKGMTITELLIGFVIVMVIFISLFSIIATYRDRLQTENYRNQLITVQSTLYKAIYDDINNVNNPLTGVTPGSCSPAEPTENSACFKYEDDSSIELALIDETADHGKQIYYDGITYDIPDSAYVEFVPIGDASTFFAVKNISTSTKTLFTIDFELEHLEINEADFGLHIVGAY
jgi:type II secretory pathway pseudopilin PulG